MNPATIIREAQADGVSLTLSPAGTIKATGNNAMVNRWLAVIREHKAEIIDVLRVGTGDTATATRWWLIHYPDREPLEVVCYPDATHAEILERHPDAVEAEPISPKPASIPACDTCQNQTGRGGCGEPVAARLSDLPGVIRYHPHQGAECPAWLARLDPDLERRILAMGARWNYSGDDLAITLEGT